MVYKPALAGKGMGIAMSKTFDTFEEFIHHIKTHSCPADSSYSFSSGSSSSSSSLGILQPFFPTMKTDIPVFEEEEWRTQKMNVVGTLLCMDGIFYGPGIFRASESEIVALSRGGCCLPAALLLPEVPQAARFVVPWRLLKASGSEITELQVKLRLAFAKSGAVLATHSEEDYRTNWTPSLLLGR
jgi:hypothetical protein